MKNNKIFNGLAIAFLGLCFIVCFANMFVVDKETRGIFIALSIIIACAIIMCCFYTHFKD